MELAYKKTPSGHYWVNCTITTKQGNTLGKCVAAELVSEDGYQFLKLLCNKKLDTTWSIHPTKAGWFIKEADLDEVKIHNWF